MNPAIKEINKQDKKIIKSLIKKNNYNPYSNIGFYDDIEKLNNYYYKLFFCADGDNKIIAAFSGTEAVGLLTVLFSEWDREIFGMKMANIGYITAAGDYPTALMIKNKLLESAFQYLKNKMVRHISVRVESNDFSSIHALENHGFKIMDNLLTYIIRNKKLIFPEANRWFVIKEIGKKDLEKAGNLLADRCVLGHYSADPAFHFSQVKNMHKKWLKNKYNDLKNNDIFVAKREEEILGCSFLSFDELLNECTGLKSLHRGLVAVKPLAAGCFFAFFNAHIKKRKDLDFAEFETQTYNYNMMHIIQSLNMRLIRSRYTFHKKL